jgi:two-component system phosphate regulon sensor histidine kinase PhoR
MKNKTGQIKTLIELNEELENYFRNTIIPQLFVDAKLVLRKFTPPAMKQFQLKEEYIGHPLADVVDNFRFPTIIDNIMQVIQTCEILEKEIQTTDLMWYQMNILPYIIKKEQKLDGVIITFIDITSRIKDLKEQEKMIAEHELLLDTIAHDIKNPIFALTLTINLLKNLPEKGMEHFPELLSNVENSLTNMKDVIYNLVQTRWQKHRYQAAEEMLDLENIIEDVKLTLAHQIHDSRANIQTNIEASAITFARKKLRSIIYNLLSNAIKYAAPDRQPCIVIESKVADGFFIISVSDNGIGISPGDQANIFNKYHKVNDEAEGNGIGLHLIKEIIESARGKISVESNPGQGSVFRVFLNKEHKGE